MLRILTNSLLYVPRKKKVHPVQIKYLDQTGAFLFLTDNEIVSLIGDGFICSSSDSIGT
jgi:hypothetical protein